MRNGRRLSKGVQYTFDSFEVTKANSKAFKKAKQFAENADSKPLAIFGGTAEQFREQYIQADVLLVDDIQELAGKEATQSSSFFSIRSANPASVS